MSLVHVDMTGKTVLVTGAGKGIGRAIALAFAEEGARIAAVSRTDKDLELLKEEVQRLQGECYTETCDVADVQQVYAMVDNVNQWSGRIDVLVNCAGINLPASILDVTEKQWDEIFSINVKGAFFTSQAVARKMIPFMGGKIIHITSQLAFAGFPCRAPYSASKAGLTQLAKVMAVEWAPYNINVNCVAPTVIRTPLTEVLLNDDLYYREVTSRIPLGRVGSPSDIVGAVLYLGSDSASLVTGTTILVDGGWNAQ